MAAAEKIHSPAPDVAERMQITRDNLRLACTLRNMTFSEVALRAGMSRNGLQQFLRGQSSLSWENLLRICDVLRLPPALVYRHDAITLGNIAAFRALERLAPHRVAEAARLAPGFATAAPGEDSAPP
jgi:transcriptional regulator with XRE-family HTH domain